MPQIPDEKDDPPPMQPERPGDEECCQSGCDPCVFDWYAQELERYRADFAAWEERQRKKDNRPAG
ncbi:MAG TPA: oxidoreductase-like domain-containing protein [Noviherbaspirillum sp.]|uniref:oxidoreductase-like domain-containing protein n=1 Tax=Noviherbaspirillum sp. TaxID=1926288 RepID=UPI002B4A9B61|nr:oxidoreductase-like domain-containing protein [Noviherbaspirillum sp.]HJV87473.1 oxidoreductase-like domain-containing protein [Noviherbaspirillum sp.]